MEEKHSTTEDLRMIILLDYFGCSGITTPKSKLVGTIKIIQNIFQFGLSSNTMLSYLFRSINSVGRVLVL